MQVPLKYRRRWLLGGGLLLLTATPSFALFGFGDIVFDPTSYASLVSQLSLASSVREVTAQDSRHRQKLWRNRKEVLD